MDHGVDRGMLVGAAGDGLDHLAVVGEVDGEELALDVAGVAAADPVDGEDVDAELP